MNGFIMSIAVSVVICEIMLNMMPDGELKKYLKVIAFSVTAIIIFTPVIGFLKEGKSIELKENYAEYNNTYYEKYNIDIYKEYALDIMERNSFYNE